MTRSTSFPSICATILVLAGCVVCQAQSTPPAGNAPPLAPSAAADEQAEHFALFSGAPPLADGKGTDLSALAANVSIPGLGIETSLSSDTPYSTPSGLETRTGVLANNGISDSSNARDASLVLGGFSNQGSSPYDDLTVQKNLTVASTADPFSTAIRNIDPWRAARYTHGNRANLWVVLLPLILLVVMISVAIQALRHNHLGNTSITDTLLQARNPFGSNG